MKKSKLEKLFIFIFSNLAILGILALCCFASFGAVQETVMAGSNSEYHGTIYAGDKSSNKVSLMVNVYWGTAELEMMLEIFERHKIKTTVFVGGTWTKDNPAILKKMYDAGHEIASHGYTHKEHGKLDYVKNLSEIQTCHEIVKQIAGIDMNLFAPPGGSYNQNTIKAAEFLGYKTIMWTRDTIDWRDHDTNLIYTRAVTNLCGGDLILMHPTKNTVEALEKIIDYAVQHGFSLTTVSETLNLLPETI